MYSLILDEETYINVTLKENTLSVFFYTVIAMLSSYTVYNHRLLVLLL